MTMLARTAQVWNGCVPCIVTFPGRMITSQAEGFLLATFVGFVCLPGLASRFFLEVL